jgi:CTP synthase
LLSEGSFARQAYGSKEISERHRHRYEFNREYESLLKQHGLRLTGETPDGVYVEICELAEHPWYLGCQFHPEFKSKPLEPHPLFRAFIGAALEEQRRRASLHDARSERRTEPMEVAGTVTRANHVTA